MAIFSQYDPVEDVIFTDVSGIAANDTQIIDDIFDELIVIARKLPKKVYVVACWRNVTFAAPSVAAHYGKRTADLLNYVQGVVRYAANDPVTRAYVRSEMVKHREKGTRLNLLGTREEALRAVRELEGAAGRSKK